MIRLAIMSPSNSAYSETFIHSHRKIPNVKVSYYYGSSIPTHLEGYGALYRSKISNRTIYKIWHHLARIKLSEREYNVINSLKKNRIDCVLAEYGTTGAAIIEIIKHLDIPLIVHFHGYDASVNQVIETLSEKYKELFEVASYVVVVSRVMETKIIQLGCPKDKIIYNVYGPCPSFFGVKSSHNSKTFVSLGRFVDKKAPYYTLLAFSKVLKEYPDASLIMGGEGYLLNCCINLSKNLGIDHAVTFPGIVSKDSFQKLLTSCRGFVQHSITALNGDMEGTPNSVLEASASGVPVVSTYHAGIPDVLHHMKSGLLVEEHDVDKMAEYMCLLLSDIGFARKLGNSARKNIKESFTQEIYLDNLSKLVQKTMKSD